MSRATSFSVAALAAVLLVVATGPAVGAVAPAPVAGPGAWSLAHPVWFDVNGDGIPQSNELTGYPVNVMTGCTVVMGDPSILGVTQTPCANVWVGAGVGGTFYQPSGVTQTLSSNAAGMSSDEPMTWTPETFSGQVSMAIRTTSGSFSMTTTCASGNFSHSRRTWYPSAIPQTRMQLPRPFE